MTDPVADLVAVSDDVRSVTLHRVSLPLRRPLGSAHGVEARRESTIVRVDLDDGTVGWGECVALARPTYSAEYADGAFRVLHDFLVPDLLAGVPGSVVGQPMATAALEGAVIDARLRAAGRSLASALGAVRRSVPVATVVGRTESIDALVAHVDGLVEQPNPSVSLKIAPGWDVEPVAALRSTWPDLELAADANGAYRSDDLDALMALDAMGLHHLEQPLPADDLVGLAEVRAALDTPIALDESIASLGELEAAIRLGSLDAVNVKPARVGGLVPTLDIVGRAAGQGLPVFCGGMLETGVGRAYALAVAALDEMVWPTHLGPSDRYFDDDLTAPIGLDDAGHLTVPPGPGIGVSPDPDRLREVEIEQVVLAASSPR
jgi:o-succinylbenzoate synthase